jgi:hypothetical protein
MRIVPNFLNEFLPIALLLTTIWLAPRCFTEASLKDSRRIQSVLLGSGIFLFLLTSGVGKFTIIPGWLRFALWVFWACALVAFFATHRRNSFKNERLEKLVFGAVFAGAFTFIDSALRNYYWTSHLVLFSAMALVIWRKRREEEIADGDADV